MSKVLLIFLLLSIHTAIAQKFKSTVGTIKFYSEELLEDITAINNKVKSIFDSETGQIVFSVTMTGFEFEKSLMQEHFNEKYLESDKYPKATFNGTIIGFEVNKMNPDVEAEGELEIHGVKNRVKVRGKLDFIGDNLIMHSIFMVKLVDYKITVPKLMFQNIAEEIEVTIDIEYKAYEK